MRRRTMILGAAGAASALVLAGGYWRVSRPLETARRPWTVDGEAIEDDRLFALSYAILAPNPHNIQPWLIRLEGQDEATLWHDPARHLDATDPFDRQITIGHGCFLELARIAAAERGRRLAIEPFPQGADERRLDKRPVARLRFVAEPGVARDPLFAAIAERRSNKGLYEPRPVPATLAASLVGANDPVVVDPARIAPIRAAVLEGIRIEMTTPHIHRETVTFMRIGRDAVEAQPDGIALTGPMIEALLLAGQIGPAQLADPGSMAFRSGLDMQLETNGSIPALVTVVTPGNSRLDQIEAGRRYARANLMATEAGLAMHPMSQTLQEYPEMAEQLAAVHRLLGVEAPARVQMLARIGYPADQALPAPRWPLAKHLMT